MSMTIPHPRHSSRRLWLAIGLSIVGVAWYAVVAIATATQAGDADTARTVAQVPAKTTYEAAAPSEGSDVPEAAAVFKRREMPDEELSPTF